MLKLNFKKFRIGLILLWVMTIPAWVLLILWLFVFFMQNVIPNPWESSDDYNWRLLDSGEYLEDITIDEVEFYEYVEGEGGFLETAFFPEQEKLIYNLKNKEQILIFFKSLSNYNRPESICYPRKGKSYFLARTLDHSTMEEGMLIFYFCKINNKTFALLEMKESSIFTNYFASSELAEFLSEIGIEP